jgi:hypothetical protein
MFNELFDSLLVEVVTSTFLELGSIRLLIL